MLPRLRLIPLCSPSAQFMCGVSAEEWLVSMLAALLLGRLVSDDCDTVWLLASQETLSYFLLWKRLYPPGTY